MIVRIVTCRRFLKAMIARIVAAATLVFLLVTFAVPSNSMPEPADDASPTERILVVRPGDSLAELLDDAGIDPAKAHAATTALSTVFPARKLRPGHEVAVQTSPSNDNALVALEIEPIPGRIARAQLRNGGWEAEEIVLPNRRFLVLADGTIIGGLFPSRTTAGMPAGLALALIRVLGHQIDFQRDLRPGDRFSVLFERIRAEDGDLLGHGQVLQVELVLSGKRLSFWRHVAPDGAIDWFDAEGRSLRRSFLRTPLDGARISSGFGRRTHPILGYSRMHQGTDFAAPTGTTIYAAADGTVVSARHEGAYGRMIRLRHASGAETRYAHL
jgi:murein DD-endopeptidase MepM/ murein hydrolase activator NlpD